MGKFFKNIFYNPKNKWFSKINNFLSIITIVTVILIVLETVESLSPYQNLFTTIEITLVLFFSIEYIGRVVGNKQPLSYMFSFFGIIDLISILPTYFGLGNLTFLKSLRTLRILRFLRMLRLVKILELQKGKKSSKIVEESDQLFTLTMEIYFATLIMVSLLSATLIWFAEGYRDVFTNIPMSMLWSIKVLLGAAPQTAETIWGDVILIFTKFCGLILFALLINIVINPIKKYLLNTK